MKLVNLGCGNKFHEEWINIDFHSNNTDVIAHNLLNGIPLKSDSVDVVYHSHVLEHFNKRDGATFLKECHRVLKSDGIIRIAVPDLEVIAKEYVKNIERAKTGDLVDRMNYDWIKLELIDQLTRHKSGGEMLEYLKANDLPNQDYIVSRLGQEVISLRASILQSRESQMPFEKSKPTLKKQIKLYVKAVMKSFKRRNNLHIREDFMAQQVGNFRLGGEVHQWMYDYFSLSTLLQEFGFKEIKRVDAFTSDILDWNSYNLDGVNNKVRKPDSLFVEANKI